MFGWTCHTSGGVVRASEPAFHPVDHTFVAGNAAFIGDDEVLQLKPEIVITEERPPQAATERLDALISSSDSSIERLTYREFADRLWGAHDAATRALDDADVRDDAQLFSGLAPRGQDPQAQHVDQRVVVGDEEVRDIAIIDAAIPDTGGMVILRADAGLGKSELLRVLEWRSAQRYVTWHKSKVRMRDAPPVALRVRLRGLQTLSLDSLARVLSDSPRDGGLGLRRISSGDVLAHLCRERRIDLLLDGLDEFSGPIERVEEGLASLKDLAARGARVVVATRTGQSGAFMQYLDQHAVASIRPLDRDGAAQLLERYGAPEERRKRVLDSLPSEVAGVPLFLLLALASQDSSAFADDVARSRTATFLELLRRFCERDWSRTELPDEMQMSMLQQLAHWMEMFGGITAGDALEVLGFTPEDKQARIVTSPHGLLSKRSDQIDFRHPQFRDVFLANALWRDWDFHSTPPSDLGKLRLRPEAIDHLAHLVPDSHLRDGWLEYSQGPKRAEVLLRRNLLATAISKLEERAEGESPSTRGDLLASILGNRDLSDVSLHSLVLERLDLGGWDLRRLLARDAHIRYCILENSLVDDSLEAAASVEGSALPRIDDPAADRIERGRVSLREVLQACMNKRVTPPALKPEIEASTLHGPDFWQMKILRGEGWVELRQKHRGKKFWFWTEKGRSLATKFIEGAETEEHASLLFKLG